MLTQAKLDSPAFIQTQAVVAQHEWQDVCAAEDVVAGTGVAARINGRQVAVFNTQQGFFSIGNLDPFSGANVLARGIVGDVSGVLVVASPVYKQHFCLKTGQCLEDPAVSVPVYSVRVCEQSNRVLIRNEAQ